MFALPVPPGLGAWRQGGPQGAGPLVDPGPVVIGGVSRFARDRALSWPQTRTWSQCVDRSGACLTDCAHDHHPRLPVSRTRSARWDDPGRQTGW